MAGASAIELFVGNPTSLDNGKPIKTAAPVAFATMLSAEGVRPTHPEQADKKIAFGEGEENPMLGLGSWLQPEFVLAPPQPTNSSKGELATQLEVDPSQQNLTSQQVGTSPTNRLSEATLVLRTPIEKGMYSTATAAQESTNASSVELALQQSERSVSPPGMQQTISSKPQARVAAVVETQLDSAASDLDAQLLSEGLRDSDAVPSIRNSERATSSDVLPQPTLLSAAPFRNGLSSPNSPLADSPLADSPLADSPLADSLLAKSPSSVPTSVEPPPTVLEETNLRPGIPRSQSPQSQWPSLDPSQASQPRELVKPAVDTRFNPVVPSQSSDAELALPPTPADPAIAATGPQAVSPQAVSPQAVSPRQSRAADAVGEDVQPAQQFEQASKAIALDEASNTNANQAGGAASPTQSSPASGVAPTAPRRTRGSETTESDSAAPTQDLTSEESSGEESLSMQLDTAEGDSNNLPDSRQGSLQQFNDPATSLGGVTNSDDSFWLGDFTPARQNSIPGQSLGSQSTATSLEFFASDPAIHRPADLRTLSMTQQVVSTLAQAVQSSDGTAAKTIDLELVPEELGHLKIHMKQVGETISTHIIASELVSSDLLASQKDTLQQALIELGFDNATVDITYGEQQQSGYENDEYRESGKKAEPVAGPRAARMLKPNNPVTSGLNIVV